MFIVPNKINCWLHNNNKHEVVVGVKVYKYRSLKIAQQSPRLNQGKPSIHSRLWYIINTLLRYN